MPSNSRHISFSVLHATFPDAAPKTYLEAPPATRSTRSLGDVTEWIKTLGPFPRAISSGDVISSMTACAFITIEIIDESISERSLRILEKYSDGDPDQLLLLAGKPAISLVQKLIENPEGDRGTETEELELHIFDLPPGIPCISPGTYVEVSHGSTIDDNVAWWGNELPGTVFGCISIEVYKEMLLPEALALIDKHHVDGRPDGLEALVSDDIKSLFQHITGR